MKKKVDRTNLIYLGVFLCLLILELFNITKTGGFIDENDNFLGGMTIVKGGMIYVDYISQHMPFMYYLCSIFNLLGAHSDFIFRLYFYVFIALIWTIMYIRYSKYFGRITMLLYPIFYITNMFTFFTSSVLSDQLQSIGMVILLMEFLIFTETNEVKIGNGIAVAFAILISFGSSFVSIYAIFTIALGVAIIEIHILLKNKMRTVKKINYLFDKYWKMVAMVCLPFFLIIVFYIIKGHLYDFYYWAFKFNTTIYSNYLGGYGSNPVRSFFVPVDNYFNTLITSIISFPADISGNLRILLCFFVNACFFIQYRTKYKYYTIIIFFFMLMCGQRGFGYDFHTLPYFGITAFMAAYLASQFIAITIEQKSNIKEKLIFIILITLFVSPFMSHVSSIFDIKSRITYDATQDKNNYAYYINKLTEKNEKVALCGLDFVTLVNSKRIPVPTTVNTPWMYEGSNKSDVTTLDTYKPRVVLFNRGHEVWGYKLAEYAPEVLAYIEQNYTNLEVSEAPELYVRNDYYFTALKQLGINHLEILNTGESTNNIGPIVNASISQVVKIEASNISKLEVMVGTYMRTNDSNMYVEIKDLQNNKSLLKTKVEVEKFIDNQYNSVEFKPININKGNLYLITFYTENVNKSNFVTLYRTSETTASDRQYAIVGGEKQSYNLAIKLFEEIKPE